METLHIYSRVSTDQQEDNTSLEQQKRKGIDVSDRLGFNYRIWNEGVGSSSKDTLDNRPVISELLQSVRDGVIKHLYVEYSDRLSRNQNTWNTIRFLLRQNGVLLYSGSDTSPIDISNPQDNLILGIMSEIAQFDNEVRTQRLHNGKFNRIKEGKWQGGPTPFGYKLEDNYLVEEPNESKWVKRIFEMYSDRKSIEEIRSELARNGVLTRRNNPIFSHGSIEKILGNTHYHGYYIISDHKSNKTYTVDCPRIIDPSLKERVETLRSQRSHTNRHKQPNKKYSYLLLPLTYCGDCGCEYGVKRFTKETKNYYYCQSKERDWRRSKEGRSTYNCKVSGSMKLHVADEIVWNTVISVLQKSYGFKETTKTEVLSESSSQLSDLEIKKMKGTIKKKQKDINIINKSIGNLQGIQLLDPDERTQTESTIDSLINKRNQLRIEISNLHTQIESTEKDKRWVDWVSEFSNRINDMKEETDLETKRKYLMGVVDRIDITPYYNNGLEHRIDITFNHPYVDDELVYHNPNKKSEGYIIREGEKNLLLKIPIEKK